MWRRNYDWYHYAEQWWHRLARPLLDVVLPWLTRSTSATPSVHEAQKYDFRQCIIMATDMAEPWSVITILCPLNPRKPLFLTQRNFRVQNWRTTNNLQLNVHYVTIKRVFVAVCLYTHILYAYILIHCVFSCAELKFDTVATLRKIEAF